MMYEKRSSSCFQEGTVNPDLSLMLKIVKEHDRQSSSQVKNKYTVLHNKLAPESLNTLRIF